MADLTITIDCTEETCSNCLLLNGWGYCTAYNMAELETCYMESCCAAIL